MRVGHGRHLMASARCSWIVVGLVLANPGAALAATATSSVSTSSEALDLRALSRLALAHNKKIKIDVARIRQAEALLSYATAQAYPVVGARLLFGGPVSEASTTVRNDVSTLTPASLENDYDFGKLGVTLRLQGTAFVPVYTFGKLSKAADAARGLVHAAEASVGITEGEVVVNVHRAYWGYQLTDSFVRSLAEGDQILTNVIAKVEELLDADSGQVTENDRLRLIHAQATLRVRMAEARDGREIAITALKLLIGRDMSLPLGVARDDIQELPEAPPSLARALDDAVHNRPELRALARVVDAHESFLGYRRRALLPDVFIAGFLEMAVTSNATDQTNPFIYDRFNYFDAGIGIGLQFQLDVFQKLAEIDQAAAELGVRTAETAAATEAIELEVRKLHIEVSGNFGKIDPAEKAFRAARAWLTAAVLGYDLGTGNANELIDAFLARATAEGDLRRTQYELQIGRADLSRAAGTLLAEVR